ncbi:MAG TPA: hypothetical protein VNZ22_05435, partial [Bacillota bacterium]|nr:hypothetical protein [Bacillota bacterium]
MTSVAGTPFQANPQDGFGPQASFNYPQGLGIDAQGNLYIGEYGAIRKVSPVGADWLVSTIGGPRGTSVDGVNKDAGFTLPMALATDAAGRVFVTDTSSHTIRLGTLAQAGALRVTLTPEEAAKAWAQWRVDGGAWHPSGDISYLPPGEHTLSFSTVFGWATPADQTVTITSNQTTTATGQYLPATTSLQVTLAPAAAVSAGARWQLNGGPWQESGTTLSGLAASYHFITFSSLDGWTTPTSQMVYVTANEAMTVTGTYIQHAGSLQVTLNPPGAVKLGAQWQVDGGPWQSNRAEIAGLAVGNHTVTFKDIPQWNTPVSLLMSIGKDSTNVTAGTYTPWETTSPTLTIITPADQRWNYPELTATGKASDNVAVATVWYQLNGSAWAVANGTSNWAANVELMPGTNTLRAYAVDTSDNKSATNSVRAVYAPSAPLVVRISGSGSVSPNYNGGMLEAGKTYTITATPDSGFVFGNWTGGLCSTSPKLSFVMESNLVLEANFIPNPFLVAKGTYSGLFALPTERRQESSGSLNLVLTDRGAYSGSCLLGGKAYALSGLFDVAGTASNTIVRAGSPALVMSLALDLTPEANQMTGYL